MDKERIIAKLREHEPELKASGVLHLSLHGSKARGDDTPTSDVDLIGDFDRAKRLTLVKMAGLELHLSDILDAPVDLSDRKMLKEQVKDRADQEALVVF